MTESSPLNDQMYNYIDNFMPNEQDIINYKTNDYQKSSQDEQKIIFQKKNSSSLAHSQENGFNSNPSSIPITQVSVASPDISVSTSYSNPQLIKLQKKPGKEQQQLSPKHIGHIPLTYNHSNGNLTEYQKYQSTVNINSSNANKIMLPGKLNGFDNSNSSSNEIPFMPIRSLNGLVSPRGRTNERKDKGMLQKIPIPLSTRNKLSPPSKHKIINRIGQNNNNLNYNYSDFISNPTTINMFNSVEIKTNDNLNNSKNNTLDPSSNVNINNHISKTVNEVFDDYLYNDINKNMNDNNISPNINPNINNNLVQNLNNNYFQNIENSPNKNINIYETRNQKASKEEKFERKFLVTQLNHKRMNFIINFINN